MVEYSATTDDVLEKGAWITLKHSELVPLNIDYFWSAFDNYLDFLKGFSGRNDVELEIDSNKPENGPGAIVRFDFQGGLVRDRLLHNDKVNHIWRMDIPEATSLFTLYNVMFSGGFVDDSLTEVSIKVEIVLQSNVREEREQALRTLLEYIPKRISEIVNYLKKRDGDKFTLPTISEKEVRDLAKNFYQLLDQHANVAECLEYLYADSTRFHMKFPNGTIINSDQFNEWYLDTTKKYFDEVHQLKQINSITQMDSGRLSLDVTIHWEASTWNAPEATSNRLVADVQQSWTVTRCTSSYKPLFETYVVNNIG